MSKKLLIGFFTIVSAVQAFAWTDGELLIWISDNRGFRALGELGKKFEEEMGVPVKVEPRSKSPKNFKLPRREAKGLTSFSGPMTALESGRMRVS
jgi:maltose-binding protein MalE